jgi:hypothetical protein
MVTETSAKPKIRMIVERSAAPILFAGALLIACDRDAPTASTSPRVGAAQANLNLVTDAPEWTGLALTLKMDVISLSDPQSTQEELPGLGHKFQLFGVMVQDTDPENLVGNSGGSGGGAGGNETISATMTPTSFALAFRSLPPGIKITALDNQLGLKYFFVNRSCGGGSPRITLLVDADGDGDFDQDPPTDPDDPPDSPDFAAHGHVNPPALLGCPPNKWVYENLTDDLPRWEVTPGTPLGLPAAPYHPWETLEAAVTAAFPFHKVLAGFLVEDSCSFFLASCGEAHYDLVTIENRTLEIWQDAVRK